MAEISTPPLQNGPWAGSAGGGPVELLLRRWMQAKALRQRYNSLWDDCFDYAIPHRGRMSSSTDGQARTDKVYDTTAVTATAEFASRLQAYVCPIGSRWAEVKPGSAVKPEQKQLIARQLKEIEDYLFGVMENSNWDDVVHEAFLDIAVGTMCILVQPGDAIMPIRFTAVPLHELTIERGGDGQVRATFRDRQILYRDLPFVFPDAKLSSEVQQKVARDPEDKVTVIEACEMVLAPEETWAHRIVLHEHREIIKGTVYRGAGSCPYITACWSRAAGDTYGRGPLANIIGAVKVLNLIVELMLEHAEIQIFGMWQVDDDGYINPDTVEMVAGAMIPRAPGSNGLEALQPGGKIDWAQYMVQEHRGEIKRALYDEPLGNMQQDSRIQTAQEVVERVADLSRRVGSSFGRLQNELIRPVIRRALYILREMGRIKMPTLNGRVVEISMTSPIARTQKAEEVVRIARFGQINNELYGQGASAMLLKRGETASVLADRLGISPNMVNSDEEIAAIENQARRQQLLEKMATGAGFPEPSAPGGAIIPS